MLSLNFYPLNLDPAIRRQIIYLQSCLH